MYLKGNAQNDAISGPNPEEMPCNYVKKVRATRRIPSFALVSRNYSEANPTTTARGLRELHDDDLAEPVNPPSAPL